MIEPPRSTLEQALEFAAFGYAVLPMWSVRDGVCGCNREHRSSPVEHPGKHLIDELVPAGLHNATRNPVVIGDWFHRYPDTNLAINLEQSGVFVVAPDRSERLIDVQRRGLPDTTVVASGSGDGHRHYYYRRPADCPAYRAVFHGDLDLLAVFHLVVPPSQTTGPYRFLTPVRPVSELPFAPSWASDLVRAAQLRDAIAGNLYTMTGLDASRSFRAETAATVTRDIETLFSIMLR